MRRWTGFALLALFAACGGSESNEPEPFTPATINGSWDFQFTRAASCTPPMTSTFPVALAFRADGTTGDLGSRWSNELSAPGRWPLIGQVDFATGVFDAKLWTNPQQTGIGLTGTFTRNGTFSGQARDPAPGFRPVYTLGVCEYNVTGARR